MGMIGNSPAQGIITSGNIQDGSIDTADLKDGAITAAKLAAGAVTDPTPAVVSDTANTSTGYFDLPSGTTAQRPASPVAGMIRYNTDTGLTENYNSAGWQGIDAPPTVTSFSGIINENTDSVITISGSNFKAGSIVYIEGAAVGGTPRALTTSFVSTVEVTAQTNATASNYVAAASFDIKVVNPSGLASTLSPAGTIDRDPVWTTASGTIGTWTDREGAMSATVAATDPDSDAVTYTLVSGSLPGNATLSTSTGVISSSDPTDVASSTTYPFIIGAVANGQTVNRSFSIIVNPTADGSSSVRAATSAEVIKTLTGTTTNGLYWINLPTVGATQVMCNMSEYGGGWMLAMKLDSTLGTGTVRHYFDPSWWANQTSGLSAAPSNPYTNGEGKYAPYSYMPHTKFMLEYGYGSAGYWTNTARAWYAYTGSFPAHNNTTMYYKQTNAGVNFSGNYYINGYRTDQTRWTRQATNDTTFFPSANAHLNYASSAVSGSDGGNDFFRIYINNNGDTDSIDDSGDCNQVGGWGMVGDFSPSSLTQMALESIAYNGGNASATISPPYGSVGATCQWNDTRVAAGSSGFNYQGNTLVRVSGEYYNSGVGLIWVK